MSKALDTLGEIESHVAALNELTQQLVDLSSYHDKLDTFNAVDTARVATQEKLASLIKGLSNYLRYGLKIEALEETTGA